MKKILFSLAVIILSTATVFAGDYYVVGVDCFNKGLYEKATKSLEIAVRQNPKNVNARYYLAQSYLQQKRVSDAENQYNRIIFLAPSSDASRLSEKGLSFIAQARAGIKIAAPTVDDLARYKDNYLDYVMTNGDGLIKWASFPVKVYIEPKKQQQTCKNAFLQWENKTNKLVSFTFVPNVADAQIILTFKDKLETSGTKENYIAGVSKPYYQGNNIAKSEIKILTIDPATGGDIEDSFVFFAALHEIGHSLGMKGHSPNDKDIMYAKSSTAKTELTQRDINTINLFYKIDSTKLASRKKGGTDVQLQQAIDYANSVPDKSVGWSNLGDLYREKKMYNESVKNYKKALAIEPEKPDLYNLLGNTYTLMNDNQNALVSLKKACDLDSSNAFYVYQYTDLCLKANQKASGKLYLTNYLKANPQSSSDAKMQELLKKYQ